MFCEAARRSERAAAHSVPSSHLVKNPYVRFNEIILGTRGAVLSSYQLPVTELKFSQSISHSTSNKLGLPYTRQHL
jgi:hypothetical protein